MKKMNKRHVAMVVAAFFMGALWVVTLRFAAVQNNAIHYHANFGLFVNGKRDEFSSFTHYEEVQACRPENGGDPRSRVHLHQPSSHAVHVHDEASTWGSFFANVGYGLSDKVLTTTDGVFVDGQDGKKLQFILNNEKVSTIANRVIQDLDVLLVSYGAEDTAALQQQYKQIPQDAAEVNKGTDPASCGGSEKLNFTSRLKRAVNITE